MNQLDYITRQLSRAQKKRFENYVVTRIWHLLNDLELKFTTQQYVSRPEEIALTDMYFPQLGIHIEVDEPHHKNQINRDEIRELDIINATGHQVYRIDVSQDLITINHRIDEVIQIIITDKKNNLNFKPWDFEADYSSHTYIDKGFIDLTDDCAFRTMVDAANCFGHTYKPKGIWKGGVRHPKEEDTSIWFPKLYENNGWNNTISDDEDLITEISLNQEKIISHIERILAENRYKRIVFARVKSPLGDIMYRFKGVYELDLKASNKENGLVWRRISKQVKTYSNALFD
ncbi:AbaSI family restriction endonuclease [Myroides sp. WP-1]|uniref:AbaSI family restriction endonuclease n=1 Tax=Myroides sp. WP-1 TaxID=2759944 RepID=UPI0015F83174|nr:hypothetical protein [Myroides sp. WP-1]MBB1137953.1 hypothetical protein [Myroides sp. WP-1]